MSEKITRVVGLGGSLTAKSNSVSALNIAIEGAREAGAESTIFEISKLSLPMYSPELDDIPAPAHELSEAVYEAGGMIWSSPMYHGTVSGSFKNALDWLQLLSDRDPPYLTNKVIGLISTAGEIQGLQAVNTMEFVVRSLRGWAVPLVIPVARAWQAFDEQGRAADPAIDSQLRSLGEEVARAAHQMSMQGYCDYSSPVTPTH